MPLIGIRTVDGVEIEAFSTDAERWDEMRKAAKGSFVMKGSLWPAILKRSIRGTQFFAHAPGFNGIKPEPESEAHLQAKATIVKALRASGYTAYVEHAGISPDGEKWQADVYCEIEKSPIAFEIQLAQQTLEEYVARTNRYINSGIKCVWLVRCGKHHLALCKAVMYEFIKQGKSPYGRPSFSDLAAVSFDIGNAKNISPTNMTIVVIADNLPHRISLAEFVVGVVKERLVFRNDYWQWRK